MVHFGLAARNPPLLAPPDPIEQTRRGEKGLRRHATRVETVAPHAIPLDERDAAAETGDRSRRDEAGRPAAENDDVVGRGGAHAAIGWMS